MPGSRSAAARFAEMEPRRSQSDDLRDRRQSGGRVRLHPPRQSGPRTRSVGRRRGVYFFRPCTGHEFSAATGFTYNLPTMRLTTRTASIFTSIGVLPIFIERDIRWRRRLFLQPDHRRQRTRCQARKLPLAGRRDRPQVGYLVPIGDMQGFIGLKGTRSPPPRTGRPAGTCG